MSTDTQSRKPLGLQIHDMDSAYRISKALSNSGLVPTAVRGKPDDILLILLWGNELEVGPASALANVAVIEGKPSISAKLAMGLCLRSPVCERFEMEESSTERATFVTKRVGHREQRITYSVEDAKRAELIGRRNWKRDPAAMLRARASMALAGAVYPDIVAGLLTPDQIEDVRGETVYTAPVEQVPAEVADVVEVIEEPPPADVAPGDRWDIAIDECVEAKDMDALVRVGKNIRSEGREMKADERQSLLTRYVDARDLIRRNGQ